MTIVRYLIFAVSLLSLCACAAGTSVSRAPSGSPRFAKPVINPSEPIPAQQLRLAGEALRSEQGDVALLILRKLMDEYPNTPWNKRALFMVERTFIQMDRPEEADAAMLRVQAEYPLLADYSVFILAEYHYDKARYPQAAALYQQIMERHPKSPLIPRVAYKRAQALYESAAFPQAEEAFVAFLKDYSRSEFAPAAGLGLGKSMTAQKKLAEAVLAYQDVWIHYPGNSIDQEVESALAALKSDGAMLPELSLDSLYERGKNLYRSGQYDKARLTFVKLLGKDEEFSGRSEVLFMAGIASFNTNKRSDAAAMHEKLIKAYPTDPRVPEALNWIGKSYSKLGEWDKGIKTFQKILDSYPESEWADDALFLTGNIYREAGDLDEALTYYGRLAAEYPDSKFADSAIWWRAWTQYTAADYKKSEQTLQTLVTRYPRSFLANQARYWQGRAAEKQGDVSRAIAYYQRAVKKSPYTYYGYRAAERLASLDLSDTVVKAPLPAEDIVLCDGSNCPDDPLHLFDTDEGPPVWTAETKKLLAAEPAFKKTLELMHVDMKKEAAGELWSLQDKTPRRGRGTLIGLSKAFFELGDYYRSYMLVVRKYDRYLESPKDTTPEDVWRLVYPQAYWENIVAYAQKYRQDPYFIAAIIREESQFNAQALSPAGARGVMQVMPATGASVAKQIKLRGFDAQKLFDADTVINIGTFYISYLMKRFKGDPLYVAAAYNAGPEAVTSWIKRNGNAKDRDVFVESIPYSETRGYVKKVLRNYAEYKRIYGKVSDIAPLVPLLTTENETPVVSGGEIKNP
jgi:soluble lytic murein transglycosylase